LTGHSRPGTGDDMPILRWLGRFVLRLLAVLIVVVALVFVAARYHDGPLGMIAGGPFKTGTPVSTPPEPTWTFVHDIPTVEFQLLSPARSRTTWILEIDGKIYIPCGYMNGTVGRLWKHWPIEAERDGRAILRIGGQLYRRQLIRVQSGAIVERLTQELARKYHAPATPAAVESGALWLFEAAPPQAAG
jgi:hypothetical protein